MKKKITLLMFMGISVLSLTGCVSPYGKNGQPLPIDPSSGWWDKLLVNPIGHVMEWAAELFNNSFAMGIVITTIIIRTIVFPIYTKTNDTSQKMQEVQPLIKQIQEKYANSKDPAAQQKMQMELMQVYREHNVNPIAGCFMPFLQMPIFMAMYHTVVRLPETVTDLDTKFLFFDLASKDKTFILPILVGASMLILQKISMHNMSAEAKANPMTKTMLYMMPAMMFIFAFQQSAALSLYWITGNIYSTLQTLIVKKPFKKDKK